MAGDVARRAARSWPTDTTACSSHAPRLTAHRRRASRAAVTMSWMVEPGPPARKTHQRGKNERDVADARRSTPTQTPSRSPALVQARPPYER
jgi:hypothetical protein